MSVCNPITLGSLGSLGFLDYLSFLENKLFEYESYFISLKLLEPRPMAKKPKTVISTFSLEPEISSALSKVSLSLGISKSALVNEMLRSSVLEISKVIPDNIDRPRPSELKRLRGGSRVIIKESLAKAQSSLDIFNSYHKDEYEG